MSFISSQHQRDRKSAPEGSAVRPSLFLFNIFKHLNDNPEPTLDDSFYVSRLIPAWPQLQCGLDSLSFRVSRAFPKDGAHMGAGG